MIAEVSIQIKAVFEAKKILRDGWIICHPPNKELHDPRTVSKQMALGLLPGMPDLIVFSPRGAAHFMEFKSENGTLDEASVTFSSGLSGQTVHIASLELSTRPCTYLSFGVRSQKGSRNEPRLQCDRALPVST